MPKKSTVLKEVTGEKLELHSPAETLYQGLPKQKQKSKKKKRKKKAKA